ncbi:uncharacterized protein HKW66_Vig0151920 [Vigna angularis]|uniref:Uncharacterized protein n=1 Tax=Phaseolus angularis TaxID=3914 RepID=A0A8T0JUM5_PHAAN|nr:uncharacterized protein HKW66_Vig0151920 [Vigna angularis]
MSKVQENSVNLKHGVLNVDECDVENPITSKTKDRPRGSRPKGGVEAAKKSRSPSPFSSSLNLNDSHPWPSRQVHDNGISSTSASSRSLKTPSSFAHNYRIAIALIPSALFLVVLGGTPVVAILNALSLKPAAFFVVCFSLIFAQVAFFLSSSSSLFAAINSSVVVAAIASFTFFLGAWSSLQFKWLLLQNPSIVVALEHLLFACLPVSVAAEGFVWGFLANFLQDIALCPSPIFWPLQAAPALTPRHCSVLHRRWLQLL